MPLQHGFGGRSRRGSITAVDRSEKMIAAARSRLAAGGRLYLFSRAPGWRAPGDAAAFVKDLAEALPRAGLGIVETRVENVGGAIVAAAIASRVSPRTRA